MALETTAEDRAVRAALVEAFAQTRQGLAALLAGGGMPAGSVGCLAALVVANCEGALMQARVAGNGQPVSDAAGMLMSPMQGEIDVARAAPAATPRRSEPTA